MGDYTTLPKSNKVRPVPFRAQIDEQKLQDLKTLVKVSPIGPATYENTSTGRTYGMTREYLTNAKKVWETEFDWRKWEDRINSHPNYTMPVENDGVTIDIHFIALFSDKADAVPLALYHGWPGSFLEFLKILDIIKEKYTPQTLPYHIIVPSLPGYTFSSGPPLDKNYDTTNAAAHLNVLMENLGFSSGYIAQGGDIGSFVSQWQASNCESCVGAHVNMLFAPEGQDTDKSSWSEALKKGMGSTAKFRETGTAYLQEHGTRTSTIGLALSASPLALFTWIGEKFLEWSHEDPTLDEILASVSLYWLTDTFARCIYPYRALGTRDRPSSEKPFGYSMFPYDIIAASKGWASKNFNLVSYHENSTGGHFAAMEKPNELLSNIDDFVGKAWKTSKL